MQGQKTTAQDAARSVFLTLPGECSTTARNAREGHRDSEAGAERQQGKILPANTDNSLSRKYRPELLKTCRASFARVLRFSHFEKMRPALVGDPVPQTHGQLGRASATNRGNLPKKSWESKGDLSQGLYQKSDEQQKHNMIRIENAAICRGSGKEAL